MIQFRDFSKTKNVWSIPCDKYGDGPWTGTYHGYFQVFILTQFGDPFFGDEYHCTIDDCGMCNSVKAAETFIVDELTRIYRHLYESQPEVDDLSEDDVCKVTIFLCLLDGNVMERKVFYAIGN